MKNSLFFILLSGSICFISNALAEKKPHALSSQGLQKIEADGTYLYKIKSTEKSQAVNFKFGTIEPLQITSKNGGYTFADMYGESPITTLQMDFEWQLSKTFGMLNAQLGVGIFSAYGNGRFETGTAETQIAKENFTIYGIPLSAGLVYRFQYWNRQWVAPYVAGGGIYYGLIEARDDEKVTVAGAPAFYAAGGLLFNITAISKSTAINFESEYGIGNLWLSVEFRKVEKTKSDFDVSSESVSAGVAADF